MFEGCGYHLATPTFCFLGLPNGTAFFRLKFKIQPADYEVVFKLLVYAIKDQKNAAKLNIDLNKGIMLSGPVGCGKTSLMTLINLFQFHPFRHVMKTCRDVSFESFSNEAEEAFRLGKLKQLEEKALKARSELKKIETKAQQDLKIQVLYQNIVGNLELNVELLSIDDSYISKYDPPTFSNLNAMGVSIVLEIFSILEDNLSFQDSELLKTKIIERFNN